MAVGIAAQPPVGKPAVNKKGQAWTGLGRRGYGQGQHGGRAFVPQAQRAGAGGAAGNKRRLPGLNKVQDYAIDQRNQADMALGDQANAMLPGVADAFSQPFDFNALPSAPVSGDFNNWRQQQIDSTYEDFNRRFDPQFQQQAEDFEQQMANRGIPMGSELYNREKTRMEQTQSDARQSAMTQAQAIAGQNAGQFFDVGTRARSGALNEGMMARNMPLNEFNQLYAARSPFDLQNLQYSQQRQLQTQNEQNQRWMMQNQPRGGGGGGGGGAEWQEMGFSSPMEYYAWKQAESRANQQWNWQNNPQYQQAEGPSQLATIGGGLIGAVAKPFFEGWASDFWKS